jgi:hypothetical protein
MRDQCCPSGEIGRRTVFRSQRSQGCAGSNPVLGTEMDKSKIDSVCPFFLTEACTEFYSKCYIVVSVNDDMARVLKLIATRSNNVHEFNK